MENGDSQERYMTVFFFSECYGESFSKGYLTTCKNMLDTSFLFLMYTLDSLYLFCDCCGESTYYLKPHVVKSTS